ncbi:porin family protein [Chryseolinea soli]|uniref:Outer membrane protein beta-barrel domain-containing protein n=1 Tax=Chryseolinea soli TaxID=2321403 RepID=A0A385SJY8_9BACT|nr:porin family protein [Chryseolinea soli]AYB29710.1 hypothetical protein D4L85_03545 [Chryseolinea soli]
MRKVTDNELDKIFRDAADRNEPEFDPKDWEDMAKRLDQDDKAALSRSKTLYTVVALLVISTLWPQFNGKDKTQTASVLESSAPTELNDQTKTKDASVSEKDLSVTDMTSASEDNQSLKEEATAPGKGQSLKKEFPALEKKDQSVEDVTASGKDQSVKEHVSASRKDEPAKTEAATVRKDQTGKKKISVAAKNRPVASVKKSGAAKHALTSAAPGQDGSSTGGAKEGLDPDNVGSSKAATTNEQSMKARVIISEKANKNISNKSPVDQGQHQAVPGVGKQSAGLQTAGSATAKDGATQTIKSEPGTANENNVAGDKENTDKTLTSDKTASKEQNIMGEAAAAGDDRLPSSANGEIILMNDGQSQSQVKPQSPPIILEGIQETKKDGSPGTAVSSESKTSGNEGTSATPNLTTHPADPAGPAAKDSTQQAEKNIAPVQAATDSGTVQKDWKNEKQAASHSWFVKLLVSPDFSSINYTSPGKPGINIGLLGEYSLSRHFSVSTGAIYSKKLYDSKDPDKSYSSGGWTAKASSLDGDCRVLDIPINVTYYIFPESKTNLFVTLGSSSYLMLKEKYVYTVWANHQDYQYEENFSHKNNEWFSMLNISIGVQRRIGEHFFVQAEPFLKAPMSGVGEGKVNLVSTGVFFSLKYKLGK